MVISLFFYIKKLKRKNVVSENFLYTDISRRKRKEPKEKEENLILYVIYILYKDRDRDRRIIRRKEKEEDFLKRDFFLLFLFL